MMTSRALPSTFGPTYPTIPHMGLSLTGGARSTGQARISDNGRVRPPHAQSLLSPYVELDRAAWARLRDHHPLSLTQDDVTRLRGLGERLDLSLIHISEPTRRT